ncbi:MAG TPA: PAS domain S-box protein [Myxococcales bacterium]|jgi:PAS domain S-box-containing protein
MQDTAELWSGALDALPFAVGLKGRDGRYQRVNSAFARLAGRDATGSLVGRGDGELPWGAGHADVDAVEDRAVLSTGAQRPEAVRSFTDAGGRVRRLAVGRGPVRDARGAVAGVLVTVREVAAEQHLEAILDTLPYPFFAKDTGLLYTACNRAFEHFIGKPREQIVGHAVEDVAPPALAEVYRRADLALLEQRATQVYESQVRNADGTLRDVIFYKGVSLDSEGRATGIVGIYVDITDRKRIEQALQESERKYRLLVEDALVGTYVIQAGKFAFCNERFAGIFGYPDARSLVGADFRALVDPEDVEKVAGEIRAREAEQKKTSHYEFRGVRQDGTRLEVEVLGSRITYEGRPAVQGTLLDVTERKRAEEERRRLEDQLRQAQKMEVVGQLAGGMAHDLNNLLLPVLGYAGLLSKDLPPGEPQEKATQILRAAERARELVWRLMAFGRKQVLELKRVDLREVVGGFERMLRSALRDDIRLELRTPGRLPAVRADSAQLEQVLMNLALNAQDAMAGPGTLRIRVAQAARPAGAPGPGGEASHVLLEVSDTGCGMDEPVRARIFEPFFTTKPVGKGTGLGLSTVLGIVQQHGGHIRFDSEPGQGTTFQVFLPASPEGTPMDQLPQNPRVPAESKGGNETILLVEDNEMVRRTTAKILELNGYRVIAAASGEAALLASQAEPGGIDLLLTDVIMPGMNGKALYQQLRSVRPTVGALFMSGHDWNVVAQKGILEDGVVFLQKPFMPEALARKVREALDARHP